MTNKADYTVDTSSIVTVTNGLVKGQNPGSATVTVKYMNQSLTLPVDVEVVRRIDAESTSVSLLLNGTADIKIMATYPNGDIADVSERLSGQQIKPMLLTLSRARLRAIVWERPT